MGEVIRRQAAVIDILTDAKTTALNAKERGGDFQRLADEKLTSTLALADDVSAKLQAAVTAAAPLDAAVAAEDLTADKLLGRISDDVWNAVGRPATDPALDILFPGGVAYYVEGDVTEQPERMELLAELLAAGIHPRLPPADATKFAAELRESSARMRGKVEAARPARLRVALLSRMQTAIARTAQAQLAGLKRMYKAAGISEAEIHRVIPDRPQKAAAKAQTTPAGEPGSAS